MDTPMFRVSVSGLLRLNREEVDKIVADMLCKFIAEERRNDLQIWVSSMFPSFIGNLREILDMLKIEYEFLKFWTNDILMNEEMFSEVDRESVGPQLEALLNSLLRPAAAPPDGEALPPPSSSN
ncbi:hypothetical protein Ancab_038113 [Ancistrocladus abbreviatus]